MKTTTRWLIAGLAAALTACGGGLLGNQGRIRLVNATTGLGALDLLIDNGVVISGVATASGSDYVLRKADTYTIDIRQSSNGATLLTTSTALVADKHKTVVAYNSGGTVAASILDDEEGDPGRNKAKFRVFNTATGSGDQVDVYLITAACSTLDSSAAAPTAAGVSGLQSAYTELASGSDFHVCVTSAGDKSDVRLEIPSLVLSEKRIVTVILARGAGGYLMNAIALDQQGAATQALNASARARVATSVPGAGFDVSVNGTAIAAGITAPNVGPYVLVPAGQAPITLKLNGNVVAPVAPLTAAPGGDVTVLLTGSAPTPTATLLADDSTPSSNGARPAKLRLVNGVNGVSTTTTATLTLNNLPVGTGAAPGQASGYSQVQSSAGLARLEARVGTQTFYFDQTATLEANRVYSLFLLGDILSPPPPNRGILVPDR